MSEKCYKVYLRKRYRMTEVEHFCKEAGCCASTTGSEHGAIIDVSNMQINSVTRY